MVKRLFDLVVSLILLILTSPIFIITALAIKLSSPGPIFYRARRAGRHGREFMMLKFRSMTADAGKGPAITAKNDSRITPVGHIIRLIKLDELPQFINVIKGDMSIVGPRPEDYKIVCDYYTDEDMQVLNARPGISCPGQLYYSTFHELQQPSDGSSIEEIYCSEQLPRKLGYDAWYVHHQSLLEDLRLIFLTIYLIIAKIFHLPFNYNPPLPPNWDISPRRKKVPTA